MFYSNETPSGAINGVNTTYTTVNILNTLVLVTVDGAIYSGAITYVSGGYSFTLADAPTATVTVSYFADATGVVSTGILVSELFEAFRLRKQDISDVGNDTFFQWCNQINRFAYNNIKGLNFRDYFNTAHYNVTDSPETQALPTDFRDMVEDKTGVYEKDTDGNDSGAKLSITGFGSTQKGFYLDGANIVFTGITGAGYRMRYMPRLSTLTATTDRMILTEDKLDYLLSALDVRYSIWDRDPSAEAMADQRFVRALGELLNNINPLPTAYGMEDITSIY
jgi:hypothetical protein